MGGPLRSRLLQSGIEINRGFHGSRRRSLSKKYARAFYLPPRLGRALFPPLELLVGEQPVELRPLARLVLRIRATFSVRKTS
jgi:hypothetical protein